MDKKKNYPGYYQHHCREETKYKQFWQKDQLTVLVVLFLQRLIYYT